MKSLLEVRNKDSQKPLYTRKEGARTLGTAGLGRCLREGGHEPPRDSRTANAKLPRRRL